VRNLLGRAHFSLLREWRARSACPESAPSCSVPRSDRRSAIFVSKLEERVPVTLLPFLKDNVKANYEATTYQIITMYADLSRAATVYEKVYIRCNSSMLGTAVVYNQSSFALTTAARRGVVDFAFTRPFFIGRIVSFHD
jgi:hypothetical protein